MGLAELAVIAVPEMLVIVSVWLSCFPELTTGPFVTLTWGLAPSFRKTLPPWARMAAFRSEPNWPHLAYGKTEPTSHSSAVLSMGPALQVICDPILCNL